MALIVNNSDEYITEQGVRTQVLSKRGYKVVPKRKPLPATPYKREFSTVATTYRFNSDAPPVHWSSGSNFVLTGDTAPGLAGGARNNAYNQSYSRIVGKLGSRAALGVAGAEARESLGLIAKRVTTLTDAFRAVRSKNPRKLSKLLGIRKPSGASARRFRSHQASDLWLEYWFGWAPLIGDIFDAVEVLQSEYSAVPVSAVGRDNFRYNKLTTTGNPSSFGTTKLESYSGSCRCHMGLKVRVSNPNLFLANQLGLVNPATVAWELVPFSFVVDWFVPIGKFLDSFSDFAGLSIYDTYTSEWRVCEGSTDDRAYGAKDGLAGQLIGGTSYKSTASKFDRSTAGPSYRFNGARLPKVSTTRAATSISLLIKLFTPAR